MHEKAVALHRQRLRREGYTRFQENVRLTVNVDIKGSKKGLNVTRIVDLAAMKPGQSLKEARLIEIKTVYDDKKDKNHGKKAVKGILKKFAKIADIEAYGRGGEVMSQMYADVNLNEKGATIQGGAEAGERIEAGASMEWNIYKYGDKGKLSHKAKFPAVRGTEFTGKVREALIKDQ